MVQLTTAEAIKRAIERAKASKLFVQSTGLVRQYRVTNRETGAQYTVDFFVRNGKRFGHCTCKAGQNNIACKHLAAAAGYHVMRMSAVREAQMLAQMPQAA